MFAEERSSNEKRTPYPLIKVRRTCNCPGVPMIVPGA